MRIITVSLTFAALLVTVPAAAVDRLVDRDLSPCVLGGLPIHATISEAVDAASAGETILVCAGTYQESIVVKPSQDDLTLRAQGVVALVAPTGGAIAFLVQSDGVTIQGFDISGYSDCAIRGIFSPIGLDILHNRFHGNRMAVCTDLSGAVRIRHNFSEDGIFLRVDGGSEVSNNTMRGGGIRIEECNGTTIDHNLIVGSGIGLIECFKPVVSNNTIRDGGIGIARTDDAVVTHNLVQGADIGIRLFAIVFGGTVSFNSVSFSTDVGILLEGPTGVTIRRNNVSRSGTIDCRWVGGGSNTFEDNNCTTEEPPGAWD
jgi:hypothetical protein